MKALERFENHRFFSHKEEGEYWGENNRFIDYTFKGDGEGTIRIPKEGDKRIQWVFEESSGLLDSGFEIIHSVRCPDWFKEVHKDMVSVIREKYKLRRLVKGV